MKKMYVIWGTLVILIFISITLIGANIINKEEAYNVLEHDMREMALAYMSVKKVYIPDNDSVIIKYDDLVSVSNKNQFNINGDKCIGYVVIKSKNNKNELYPYIKCKKYVTDGYEKQ